MSSAPVRRSQAATPASADDAASTSCFGCGGGAMSNGEGFRVLLVDFFTIPGGRDTGAYPSSPNKAAWLGRRRPSSFPQNTAAFTERNEGVGKRRNSNFGFSSLRPRSAVPRRNYSRRGRGTDRALTPLSRWGSSTVEG